MQSRPGEGWRRRLAELLRTAVLDIEHPHPDPTAVDVGGGTVDVLVLVDAMWVLWGPFVREPERGAQRNQPWQRHERFLRSLLQNEWGRIDAWILSDPMSFERLGKLIDHSVGPIVAPVRRIFEMAQRGPWSSGPTTECQPGPDKLEWHSGATAERTLKWMVDGLRACNRLANQQQLTNVALVGAVMNLFACRIYLRPDQLNRLTGPQEPSAGLGANRVPHACLDLRFRHSVRRFWISATLSLWSHQPTSRHNVPTPRDPADDRYRPPVTDPAGQGRAMVTVRTQFNDWLKRSFEPIRLTVFDQQRYRPPRFWVASGASLEATDAGPAGPSGDLSVFHELSRAIQEVPEPGVTGVAQGLVEGEVGSRLRVLRWFVQRESAPCYLIIPPRTIPADRQEDAVRELVYSMTRIEARAAATLYDVSTDLDMNGALVAAYQEVADCAGALWDELSMHLPVAHGRRLNQTHALAELMHQVLLQGIVDLELAYTAAQEIDSSIRTRAEALVGEFDEKFIELPMPLSEPIRDSVRRGGYVARTERSAKEAGENASQARDTYKALLDGFTYAFDERRVRVTDKIGFLAVGFGLLIAMFSLFNEGWAAFLNHDPQRPSFTVLFWAGVGFVSVVVVAYVLLRRRLGVLNVSRQFGRRYSLLRRYLANCRTDHLETLLADTQAEVCRQQPNSAAAPHSWWGSYYRQWDALDARLAQQCAEVIDKIAAFSPARRWRRGNKELALLRDKIERWGLVALFATERPRSFYRFPLPRLMLLHRCYPIWHLLGELSADTRPGLVADSDLWLQLLVQCMARPDDVELVRRWADQCNEDAKVNSHSAVEVLQTIAATGIKASMTEQDWAAVRRQLS